MKKQDELVMITKTYDLILWSCNNTGRFPWQHRFVFCFHAANTSRTTSPSHSATEATKSSNRLLNSRLFFQTSLSALDRQPITTFSDCRFCRLPATRTRADFFGPM